MSHKKIPFANELQLFHQASKIPLCVFDNTPKDILRYPFLTSMECSPDTLKHCCNAINCNPAAPQLPIFYSSETCFFALLKLSDECNVIFGPVSPAPLTYSEFYQTNQTGYIPGDFLHLYRITQLSPHISLGQFASNLALFVRLAFQITVSTEELLVNHVSFPTEKVIEPFTATEQPHYLTISEAIAFQKKILTLLQDGNTEEVKKIFSETALFTNLEIAPSSINDFKKIFFIYATLCCVAVLEEGLNLKKAFPIFDTYISKIPSITAPEKLADLCKQISIDYCRHMAVLKDTRSDSPIVTKCLQYIHDNITSKIAIHDLAAHCQASTRTISRHFAEYYEMSVSEYILLYKLKEAAFMLTNSDFTLIEISNYLAFSSQSHFSVAFKKKYHYTPQKYREKYKVA